MQGIRSEFTVEDTKQLHSSSRMFKYAGVGVVPDLAKIFSLLDSSEAGCLKKVGEVIHFDDAAVDEVIEKRFLRSSQLRFSSGKLLYNSESVVFK